MSFRLAAVCFALVLSVSSISLADDDDVVVSADPKKKPEPAPQAAASSNVEERLRKLEEKNAQLEEQVKRTKDEGVLPSFLRAIHVNGFVQGEYQSHQDSVDQVGQGNVLLNRDRFVLRRARVRVEGDWRYARLQLEADANTVNGPIMRPLHAFGTVQIPALDNKSDVPVAAATVGLFDTPFGYELLEWPRNRWFMERSTAGRAFFASEPDLGIKFHGGLAFARWSIALMNGQPLDTKSGYPTLSPANAKDIVLHAGVDTHPTQSIDLAGGVSALRGKGFHAGTDATKNQLLWRDVNEDGTIQPTELMGAPATSAIPSQTFDHWMIGADLQFRLRTKLGGTTAIFSEVFVAQNMDRNLYVGDPALTGLDIREIGFVAGFTQDITKWGVIGFRYDFYDPNSDFLDTRGGKLVPTAQSIHTFSPMVGLTWPDRARLIFQYDIIRDHFARNASGVPTDLKNDAWTLRLQVNL